MGCHNHLHRHKFSAICGCGDRTTNIALGRRQPAQIHLLSFRASLRCSTMSPQATKCPAAMQRPLSACSPNAAGSTKGYSLQRQAGRPAHCMFWGLLAHRWTALMQNGGTPRTWPDKCSTLLVPAGIADVGAHIHIRAEAA